MTSSKNRSISAVNLQSERLAFRPFIETDFDALAGLDGDPDVVRFLGHGRVKEPTETRTNLNKILTDYTRYGLGLYATTLKDTGDFVGRTGLIPWQLDGELVWEVGYSLAKQHWGKGLATEAAAFWKAYGFSKLGVGSLVSLIHPENQASMHVASKIGMRRWKDVTINGLELAVFRVHA
jgi:RimJ/RimL family protein N-acetyltransferase